MRIFIVRHAIAEDFSKSGRDEDRELSPAGRKKMKVAAAGFAGLGMGIDRVFTSPLIRARQTAEILARELKYKGAPEETEILAPGHSPEEVCAFLRTLKSVESVALTGHEPNCSQLVSYLLSGPGEVAVEFKKGAICLIESSRPQRGTGILIWHLSPMALRSMKWK